MLEAAELVVLMLWETELLRDDEVEDDEELIELLDGDVLELLLRLAEVELNP